MELNEIVKNLRKHNKILLFAAIVGILGGYLFYLAPKPYYATGSFYVKRAVDTTKFQYFSYEGYYGQQAGLSYTNTVLALFESLDVRYEALNSINLPTDIDSLKKYSGMIKVKKTGPQIITLTIKGKTLQKAEDLWNSISSTTIEKSKQININGDPLLSISKISENPVVKIQYKPLWACVVFGFVLTPLFVIFYHSLKGYFK
jgi:capsular polysaccharide biosynthesis protein